ncbi:STAS domain-containing protein [Actinoplanes sp. NPDC051859]|uniref:STAS domain-containing protein n=1 Tax=Actinoplanes sp. NPDC051859 TaxID=3363909 RepID=UPI0037A04B36
MHSWFEQNVAGMTAAVRWEQAGAAVVEVTGDLDLASAPELTAVLDRVCAEHPERISVDLAGITFFSCAAVRELLSVHRRCPAALTIVRPAGRVRRVMDTLGLGWDLQALSL